MDTYVRIHRLEHDQRCIGVACCKQHLQPEQALNVSLQYRFIIFQLVEPAVSSGSMPDNVKRSPGITTNRFAKAPRGPAIRTSVQELESLQRLIELVKYIVAWLPTLRLFQNIIQLGVEGFVILFGPITQRLSKLNLGASGVQQILNLLMIALRGVAFGGQLLGSLQQRLGTDSRKREDISLNYKRVQRLFERSLGFVQLTGID